ncbi:MAG: cyclic nucleotide-binding domain-containing protein [Sphaerochaetaceae bacterium]
MVRFQITNEFLRQHSMFGGLSEEELNLVRPLLVEHTYLQDQTLLNQGEPNSTVYFIVSGEVSVVKNNRLLTTLTVGDSFGEMELIDIQPCAASVITLSEVNAVTLSNRDLYKLSQNHLMVFTIIIMNLARDISRRLRKTDDLLAMVSKQE